MDIVIGGVVEFVDETARSHEALILAVGGRGSGDEEPTLDLVYLSSVEGAATDSRGVIQVVVRGVPHVDKKCFVTHTDGVAYRVVQKPPLWRHR